MSVSRDEVERVAALARLRLEEEEAEALTRDLDRILEYVDRLSEVDVSAVEELGYGVDWSAPERRNDIAPDRLGHPPSEGAPDWREGFFVVPRLPAVDPERGGAP